MSDKEILGADAAADVTAEPVARDQLSHAGRVYSVYKSWGHELFIARADVVKRGAKTITLHYDTDDGRAFGYRSRFSQNEFAATPEEALQRYRENLRRKIASAEREVAEHMTMLDQEPVAVWERRAKAEDGTPEQHPTTAASDVAQKES